MPLLLLTIKHNVKLVQSSSSGPIDILDATQTEATPHSCRMAKPDNLMSAVTQHKSYGIAFVGNRLLARHYFGANKITHLPLDVTAIILLLHLLLNSHAINYDKHRVVSEEY